MGIELKASHDSSLTLLPLFTQLVQTSAVAVRIIKHFRGKVAKS